MTIKKKKQNQFLKDRLARMNQVFEKFEVEVEKAINKIMKRGEKSSRLIRQNLDEIIERVSSSDIYSKATEKTEAITSELRQLRDDVVSKLKKFDLKVGNNLLQEIRGNIDQIVEKIQETEFVEIAKDKAQSTKKQVLTALSIPSQDEVDTLSRKIGNLERKLKVLSKNQAA